MSSLYGAMRSGVSGVAAYSQAMAMVSDNIANVNTNAYKISKAKFSTLVTQNPSPTLYSSGGVQARVFREYSAEGLLQASAVSTDMAIRGNGFFTVTNSVVRDPDTGIWSRNGEVLFTRAAEFRPDENGNLKNAAGYYLLGWPANDTDTGFVQTNVQGNFDVVNVSARSSEPIATTEFNLSANLNGDALQNDTFNVSLQIFGRQGNKKTLSLTFTKQAAADTWLITAELDRGRFIDIDTNDDADISALDTDGDGVISDAESRQFDPGDMAMTAVNTAVTLGQVTFDANGNLAAVASDNTGSHVGNTNAAIPGVIQLLVDHNGLVPAAASANADAVLINLNLGTVGTALGLSQFAGESIINKYSQNGKTFGSLNGVTVDEKGVVTALFDNGARRHIYQLPVSTFPNPDGLLEESGNVFTQTDFSGEAIAHVSATGGSGKISPASIEASTVDLATEFTDMIVTQRAYSANTKIISTADEMLEELIRTKR